MELYTIPLNSDAGKFILYRPRIALAFVGNRPLAEIAQAFARGETPAVSAEVRQFLENIGFFKDEFTLPEYLYPAFRPATAVLLLTNQCQLRCTYCYAAAGEFPREELTPELGKTAIDYVCEQAQAAGFPHFEVSFHGGGEPTYHWHVLQQCADYARSKALPAKLSLTSNGLWSPAQAQWIIANLDGVSLSVDGSPATQDQQRPLIGGRGSSEFVLRAIAALDSHDFPYGIRMTATAPFTQLAEDVRYLCENTHCRSIQVEPAFNITRGGHGLPVEAEARAYVENYLAAYDIASAAGRRLHYSGGRAGMVTTTFCTAPYQALIVNANGDLVTCYEVASPLHPLARLSTIGRIENGDVQVNAAARARLHDLMAARRKSCEGCYCYWSCAGDCYARAFGRGANGHLVHSQRCDINRAITQGILLRLMARSGGIWRGETMTL
ncbi:MAG: radical SAM protein [Chloroflexi bacterium]|nr:radical SAM protein [Chloroflexota bacterium]